MCRRPDKAGYTICVICIFIMHVNNFSTFFEAIINNLHISVAMLLATFGVTRNLLYLKGIADTSYFGNSSVCAFAIQLKSMLYYPRHPSTLHTCLMHNTIHCRYSNIKKSAVKRTCQAMVN